METIRLKGIDLPVSRLCAGGGAAPPGNTAGGRWTTIRSRGRFAAPLNAASTSLTPPDTYGLGRSESNIGQALHDVRGRVVIASKFGVRVENGRTFYDNSPAYIDRALAASLKRLNTDYIDLYQVHYLDGVTPVDEMMEALLRHKRAGRIRAVGLSNVTPAQAAAFIPTGTMWLRFRITTAWLTATTRPPCSKPRACWMPLRSPGAVWGRAS